MVEAKDTDSRVSHKAAKSQNTSENTFLALIKDPAIAALMMAGIVFILLTGVAIYRRRQARDGEYQYLLVES